MKRITSQAVCLGGLLTAIAVILQSAPVFLPSLGLFLSPLSTLPIAIAAKALRGWGVLCYSAAALILFFISAQEAAIFLLTTGLLGLVLGLLIHRTFPVAVSASGLALFLGISTLIFLVGIPAFGDFLTDQPVMVRLGIFGLFSLLYASLWVFVLKRFGQQIKRVGP